MKEEIVSGVTKIINYIMDMPDDYPLSLSSKLREDIGMDSIDFMDMSLDIEATYNYPVADECLNKFNTVQDVIEYVERFFAEYETCQKK